MYKKIFFILVLIILLYTLYSSQIDISWNNPELISRYNISFLENNSFQSLPLIEQEDQISFFALNSSKNLLFSIKDYFSRDSKKSFLQYGINTEQISGFFCVSPQVGFEYFLNEDQHFSFIHYGLDLKTNLNNTLFLTANWWSGHYSGDLSYAQSQSPILDGWNKFSDSGDIIYLDNINGRLDWRGTFGSLAIGRGTYEIGSNISSSIILDNSSNDYGYLSGIIDLGKIKLSILHANLIPDSTNSQMGTPYNLSYKYEDKFLVIHKIDWIPTAKAHFFIGESIIYGSRSIEPSYLLPHFFQRITEHNLADRDNVLIFAGTEIKPIKPLLLYANFILDELKKSEILGDWWGNKYALQVGSSFKSNCVIPMTTTLEFTAVRPWLYTHNIMVNKYSNDDISLGYQGGSNLIQYSAELNFDITTNLTLDIKSDYKRQGSIGNSYQINYNSRPKDTAEWLEGDITDTLSNRFVFTWNFLSCHSVKIGCQFTKIMKQDDDYNISLSYFTTY